MRQCRIVVGMKQNPDIDNSFMPTLRILVKTGFSWAESWVLLWELPWFYIDDMVKFDDMVKKGRLSGRVVGYRLKCSDLLK